MPLKLQHSLAVNTTASCTKALPNPFSCLPTSNPHKKNDKIEGSQTVADVLDPFTSGAVSSANVSS